MLWLFFAIRLSSVECPCVVLKYGTPLNIVMYTSVTNEILLVSTASDAKVPHLVLDVSSSIFAVIDNAARLQSLAEIRSVCYLVII